MSPREPTEFPAMESDPPEVRRSVRAWMASSTGPAAATRAAPMTSESARTQAPRRDARARTAAENLFIGATVSEADADREDEGIVSVGDHVLDLTVRLQGHRVEAPAHEEIDPRVRIRAGVVGIHEQDPRTGTPIEARH